MQKLQKWTEKKDDEAILEPEQQPGNIFLCNFADFFVPFSIRPLIQQIFGNN